MKRSKSMKVFLSILLTFLMVFSNVNVFAEINSNKNIESNTQQSADMDYNQIQGSAYMGNDGVQESSKELLESSEYIKSREMLDDYNFWRKSSTQINEGATRSINQLENEKSIALTLGESQVSGIVRNIDGSLASSGYIDIRETSGYGMNAQINEDGSYSIAQLENGKIYTLQARSYSSNEDMMPSKKVTIKINSEGKAVYLDETTAQNIDFQFTKPQVVVRVNKNDGTPATNICYVEIRKVDGNNEQFISPVWESSQGNFNIGALDPGTYVIQAYPNGDDASLIRSEKHELVIDAAGICNEKSITLTLGTPQISGVVKGNDSLTIKYGHISIRDVSTNDGAWDWAQINDNGFYSIGQLEKGKVYSLQAYPDRNNENIAPSRKVIIKINSEGKAVYLDETTARNIDFKCDKPQVVVKVNKNDGTSAMDMCSVEVRKVNENNEEFIYSLDQSNLGSFNIGGLEPGTYSVQAYPYGNVSDLIRTEKYQIIIDADGNCNEESITLTLGTPQISGVVKNTDSSLASFGYIRIREINANGGYFGIPSAQISNNGSYSIGQLENGKVYQLQAYPDRNSENMAPSKKVTIKINSEGNALYLDGTVARNISFLFTKPQVVVSVNKNDGTPAIDICSVEVRKVNENNNEYVYNVNQSSQGNFNIGALEPGTYTVQAYPYGDISGLINSEKHEVIIDAYGNSNENLITLTLGTPQISGIVKNDDDSLASSGYIEIRDINGYGSGTQINQDGSYSIGQLQNGKTYELQARPDRNTEDMAPSRKVTIKINSDGKAVYLDETIADNIDFQFTKPQVVVKVNKNDGTLATDVCSVEVRKVNENNDEFIYQVDQSSLGNFNIGGLDFGTYIVQAYPYGNISGLIRSEKHQIVINTDGTCNEKLITLTLGTSQISGVVKNTDSSLASFGYIRIREISDNGSNFGISSAQISNNGSYSIGQLENGKVYQLQAYPDRNSENMAPSKKVTIKINSEGNALYLDGTVARNISFQFTKPQVVVTVNKNDGTSAIDICSVEVRKVNENNEEFIYQVEQSSQGNFNIGALEPGTYNVQAYPYWNMQGLIMSEKHQIVVDAYGNSNEKSITLTLGIPQISGVVKNDDDSLASSGYIQIREINVSGAWGKPSAKIKEDGTYSIGQLENGKVYQLQAYPDRNNENMAPSKKVTIKISNEGKALYLDGTNASNIGFQFTKPQVVVTVNKNDETPAIDICSVEVHKVNENNEEFICRVEQSSQGNFNIGALEQGTYNVQAYPNGNISGLIKSEKYQIIIDAAGNCNENSITLTLGESQFTVSSTSIADGTKEIEPALASKIKIKFNDLIDKNSVIPDNFILRYNDSNLEPVSVPVSVAVDPTDSTQVIVTATTALRYSTEYTLNISGDVESQSGQYLEEERTISFTTKVLEPLTIKSTSIEEGAKEVDPSLTSNIKIKFSDAINKDTVNSNNFLLEYYDSNSEPVSVAVNVATDPLDATQVMVTPITALRYSTDYTLTIRGDVKSKSGQNLEEETTLSFTTKMLDPLTIESTSIKDGATEVEPASKIKVKFSHAIDKTTVIPKNFMLQYNDSNSQPVSTAITVAVDSLDATQVIVTPITTLRYSTDYILTIKGDVKSKSGQNLEEETTLSFTTKMLDPLTIESTKIGEVDGVGAEDVDPTSKIKVKFSDTIDKATVIPKNFILQYNDSSSEPVSVPVTVVVDSLDATQVIVTPTTALRYSTEYTLTITGDVKSKLGQNLEEETTLSFTTKMLDPLTIKSTSIEDGATEVDPTSKIKIIFTDTIDKTTAVPKNFMLHYLNDKGTDTVVSTKVTVDPKDPTQIIIAPSKTLLYNTEYNLDIKTDVKSRLGQNLEEETTISFTTSRKLISLTGDKSVALIVDASATLTVNALYEGDEEPTDVAADATYTVKDTKIATIDESGNVIGQAQGKTTITCSYKGKKITINVVVIAKPDEIIVSTENTAIEAGKSFNVKVFAFYSEAKIKYVDITSIAKWTSDDDTIATVASGKITAKGTVGDNTSITVSIGDYEATTNVNIVNKVKKLTIDATSKTLSLAVGDTASISDIIITAIYTDANFDNEEVQDLCAVVSSKPTIVSIVNGQITANATGKATLTFTYGSKTVTVNVTVK